MTLKTQNLTLRPPTESDLDAIAAMWGDPESGKYMPDPYYTSGEEIKEILEDDPDCPVYYFVATLHDGDEIIATCSLGMENAASVTWSIGYNVKKSHRGKGYAPEMINALISFARELNLKTLTAPVAQANKASNRVMEKCGFRISGESSFKKSGTDIVQPSYVYKKNLFE